MARGSRSQGGRGEGKGGAKGGTKGGLTRKPRPKVCYFCKESVPYIDYKDAALLRRYVSDRGKIRARRVTGCCARHQRDVSLAVKNAREMALLPYTMR